MRSIAALLSLLAFLFAILAVFLFRTAWGIDLNVEVDGLPVANAAMMHHQQLAIIQGVGAALATVILVTGAGITAAIERR